MGYKYSDENITCPLYRRVTRTTKGKTIIINCSNERFNLGFEAEPCLRFKTHQELKDYIELFCGDRFEHCPMYRAFVGQ